MFDIDKLRFVYPTEFVRLENEQGESLNICTDVDRMEAELLRQAPEDASEIRQLESAVRRFTGLEMPDLTRSWPGSWLIFLRTLPYWPLLRRWSGLTIEQYGRRFTHPLLRGFFGEGEMGHLSALALVLSLAWMSRRDAGYPIGGSQAVMRLIVENLRSLGGQLRFGAKVERILVKRDVAVGLQLADGEVIAADWVISAADGHATIYDLLGGKYKDKSAENIYSGLKTFPSYLQVSLGVAQDLSYQARYVTRIFDAPLIVDPITQLSQVSFRLFHFDPTFAPAGKTAVTCFLPTRNFDFWVRLASRPCAISGGEATRRAGRHRDSGKDGTRVRRAIEVNDVSTPATVIRYTNNWKGSMEGWLLTPGVGFKPLRNTLPGLRRFFMVGQWVMPGGGLPSGFNDSTPRDAGAM